MLDYVAVVYDVRVVDLPEPAATKLWREVLLSDPCSYCGGGAGTRDHIDAPPFDRLPHRDDSWRNLTAACRSCNSGKNDRSLLAFLGRLDVGDNRWEYEKRRMARWRAQQESMS